MRSSATLTLGIASFFLAIVAVMLGSPGLFYMGTALIATIAAAKLQSWLAVRGLRIQRVVPKTAQVGERVNVTLTVASDRRINRPLVLLKDALPPRLEAGRDQEALPIAPAYGSPIATTYAFRPTFRGVYRWNKVEVSGADALGLVTSHTTYQLRGQDAAELKVYPTPIPFDVPISFGGGGGVEAGTNSKQTATGIDVRSVRDYVLGDPIRHIHWKSSARLGRLMVKEFDADYSLRAAIVIQNSPSTEFMGEQWSTLEASCGHALYLAERLLSAGGDIIFPGLEDLPRGERSKRPAVLDSRLAEVREMLAMLKGGTGKSVSELLRELGQDRDGVGHIYLFLATAEPEILTTISLFNPGSVTAFLYNGLEFSTRSNGRPLATSHEFMESLQRAGARTFVLGPGRSISR